WCFLWPALIYFVCTQTTGIARLRTPGLGFAVLSLIWWILFYSASGSKSPPYMLPTLVPLALVLGACLDANWRTHGLRFHWLWTGLASAWPRWTTTLMLAGLVGCALATALLEWQGWTSAAAEMVAAGLLLALWLRFGRHAGPRLTWGICAAAILAFNLFAVQDLVAGAAGRHSPEAIARKIRRWKPGCVPVVWRYGRQWPSSSFYLRRDGGALFCPRETLPTLIAWMRQLPETLIIVETGPLLEELMRAIPPSLQPQVILPKKQGQVAL